MMGNPKTNQNTENQHPKAFPLYGPQNIPSVNWNNNDYKRIAIACFIQAVYLLELDRQENRSSDNPLAPKWWIPFKYKLVKKLVDQRDKSIIGAILKWDRFAARADFFRRPSGAPRAVLALRGTILKSPTIRRDVEDDIRYFASESLEGSPRFESIFLAMKSISCKYGSSNVCIAGHSLGAGFSLQVVKALAEEGISVESHLFNPPSVSLRNMGEKAKDLRNKFRSMFTSEKQANSEATTSETLGSKQLIPHLYINYNDYICRSYAKPDSSEVSSKGKESTKPASAILFVVPEGNQKFPKAHWLKLWWSNDLEFETVVNNSKLLTRQLKSLYNLPPSKD